MRVIGIGTDEETVPRIMDTALHAGGLTANISHITHITHTTVLRLSEGGEAAAPHAQHPPFRGPCVRSKKEKKKKKTDKRQNGKMKRSRSRELAMFRLRVNVFVSERRRRVSLKRLNARRIGAF